jgi:hypothetical protein
MSGAVAQAAAKPAVQARANQRDPSPNSPRSQPTTVASSIIRRKPACACGGSCPNCKAPSTKENEESPLQIRREPEPLAPQGLGGGPLPPGLGSYLHNSASGGHVLAGAPRQALEASFGRPLGGVHVIHDESAARAATALQARAFTLGNAIWFGRGEYRPETPDGFHLLAHEVAHSAQHSAAPSRVHADLVVGPANDPVEREADRAADAAMRGERASLSGSAQGTVHLQRIGCSASPASRPDQRIVRCPNGDFLVTLTTTTEPSRPDTQVWTNAGWNDSVIWLQLGVCSNATVVTITPTVDLPRAVLEVLGNVLSGSGALSGVSLTTGLRISVLQSRSFTLSVGPTVTVDQSGVTGVGGSVTVQTDDVTASVGGTYDPQTRSGGLTFTLSEGAPQRRVDCTRPPRQRLVFECRPITHVPGTPEVPEQRAQEERYLFFRYAQSTVAPDFQRPAARRGTTPGVDLRERIQAPTDLPDLHRQGYRVIGIEGFTSPEGPRQRETRTFEGNIELAQSRADAALRWVGTQCPECNTSGVTPQGRAELPPVQGALEPEPRGRTMERGAVQEFLQTDPLRPGDPAVEAEFRRLPERSQRDQVFELQRRAVIHLERVVQQRVPEVAPRDETGLPGACAEGVTEAARASFGIGIL